MDCSIRLGKFPDCSGHSVGRRSIEETEPITVQYEVVTLTETEQLGDIHTSKAKQFAKPKNSASAFGICCLLFLFVIQYI